MYVSKTVSGFEFLLSYQVVCWEHYYSILAHSFRSVFSVLNKPMQYIVFVSWSRNEREKNCLHPANALRTAIRN